MPEAKLPAMEPQPLILVLTMGRVGSTSIYHAIERRIGGNVLHIHSVNPHLLARQVAKGGGLQSAPRSVLDGLDAVKGLLRYPRRSKIVTLVREPVSRAYSVAFASLLGRIERPAEVEAFLDHRHEFDRWWSRFDDRRPLDWFDQQFRDVLGIDVYDTPFPSSGWCVLSGERCDVLILRTELHDAAKSGALAGFLGVDDIPIEWYNAEARTGELAPLYERFKQQAKLSPEYLGVLVESRYRRHFYP